MKKFSEFGIKPTSKAFTGDKIKMERILNREIIVHDFRIEDSKIKAGTKCLYLQIELNGNKHVVFTSGVALQEVLEKVPEFPFTSTIVKQDERLEFT